MTPLEIALMCVVVALIVALALSIRATRAWIQYVRQMQDSRRSGSSKHIDGTRNDGAVEWAILYPTLKGGELDRVLPVHDYGEAEREKNAWAERGIYSIIVNRTISAWAPAAPPKLWRAMNFR